MTLLLTHSGRGKMDAISQTPFSKAFSWIEMYEFWLRSHWSLFLKVQLTIFQHWFRQWLSAGQVTSHCLNQWWLIYWCIYASLSLSELNGPNTHPSYNNRGNHQCWESQMVNHSLYRVWSRMIDLHGWSMPHNHHQENLEVHSICDSNIK